MTPRGCPGRRLDGFARGDGGVTLCVTDCGGTLWVMNEHSPSACWPHFVDLRVRACSPAWSLRAGGAGSLCVCRGGADTYRSLGRGCLT